MLNIKNMHPHYIPYDFMHADLKAKALKDWNDSKRRAKNTQRQQQVVIRTQPSITAFAGGGVTARTPWQEIQLYSGLSFWVTFLLLLLRTWALLNF
jgi:hypothetical protein